MVSKWVRFLEGKKPGFFKNEKAILKKIKSKELTAVYTLGKTLDIHAENESTFWKKVTDSFDVSKSEAIIEEMQTFWTTRKPGGADVVKIAADNFYWAIMGSLLVALKESEKNNKSEAANVVHKYRNLFLYFSEYRDRGVNSRHPEELLKGDHGLHWLYAESGSAPQGSSQIKEAERSGSQPVV